MPRIRTWLCLAGLFLTCSRAVFGQCEPEGLRLQPTQGPIEDLQEQLKSRPLKVVSGDSDYYTREVDRGIIVVDLMGGRIGPQDLPKVALELPGFHFKIDPRSVRSRVPPGASACVGTFAFEVSRVWQVKVTAEPRIALTIKLDPGSPAQGVQTPIVVPTIELDWTTTLRLDVYPAPGNNKHHYDVELRAADFSRSSGTCGEPKVICHEKKDIYEKLLASVLGSSNRSNNDVLTTLKENTLKRELESAPVVNRITFSLQP